MTKATTTALDGVTILFCGDSGDGMQLAGSQFTSSSAMFGNDVSTLPDYPAEIRAPAGSLAGVSAFQINFASHEIHTSGDEPEALVAMNPAALKVNLHRLKAGGVLIANADAFTKGNLKKAGYDGNPLGEPELDQRYKLHSVPITTLTLSALEDLDLDRKSKQRCKNFFTLGLIFWLFDRPLEPTLAWIESKFARRPALADANARVLKAGFYYGDTAEAFAVQYQVAPAKLEKGTHRIINGNEAAALGFASAARLAEKPLVYCSYPITPATDVLHHLARMKHVGVRTLQLEDEIAAMGATIGAAFGGTFALTGTSGPGVCLKSEAINLAMMLELPLVILNVQRGGPSTGLPTKTEQSDLLQVLYGRNGESPIPVIAARSPADCFDVALEAFRIAVRHSTPVFMLSDGYIANGAEPWHVPRFADLAPIEVEHPSEPEGFQPYARDEKTLARPWAIPGVPGLEHRIGGLEKEDGSGNVCYDPENHEKMCRLRAEKVDRICDFIPAQEVTGSRSGELLVVSWGGTYGAVLTGVQRAQQDGSSVAHAHLRHLNPLPRDLGQLLSGFERVLVPELNRGQLASLLRARYLVDATSLSNMQGRPFTASEVHDKIEEVLA